VLMYTTKSCGYCARAREYFTAHGIHWTEIDIESSAQAAADFEALGGKGTPLIFIDKKRIFGFDQAQIESAL
jgi:mycoredoxin